MTRQRSFEPTLTQAGRLITNPDSNQRIALSALSSRQLAMRAQGRSLPAFTELVTRYERRLFNFLLRRVPCAADAEDIVQEAFVRAWQSIDRYDPTWEFSTWLYTIARRLAANELAAARRRARLQPMTGADAQSTDPAQIVADRESQTNLWTIAQRVLNPDQQSALWLRYAEQMSVQDIANILGRTRVSVRVLMFRARKALANEMIQISGIRQSDRIKPASLPEPKLPTARVVGGLR